MNQHFRGHLLVGVFLIAIGTILLITNISDFTLGWSYLGPIILMLIGVLFFSSIRSRRQSGAIFPGTIFFLTGLAFFLTNFDAAYDFIQNIEPPTFIVLVIGIAFLALYLCRLNEVGLLIPTGIFLTLGLLLLFNDFYRIDWDWVHRLWPLIPILIGVGIVMRGISKRTDLKKTDPEAMSNIDHP
ncbi:DUF5668 domain-containing protein [candidate division KSB1 bacterium]|nr:DUF5668 domain-containing protein [candidate division KSB1 bacterium]